MKIVRFQHDATVAYGILGAKEIELLAGFMTGTPAGVGFARRPPVFLKAGDVVEVDIAGLGVLHNSVAVG